MWVCRVHLSSLQSHCYSVPRQHRLDSVSLQRARTIQTGGRRTSSLRGALRTFRTRSRTHKAVRKPLDHIVLDLSLTIATAHLLNHRLFENRCQMCTLKSTLQPLRNSDHQLLVLQCAQRQLGGLPVNGTRGYIPWQNVLPRR